MDRVGILTGGGDCPGLNAVIRAVVVKAYDSGWEVLGIKDGWKGMVKNDTMPLGLDSVAGILSQGGTILGTSRTNPYKKEEDIKKVRENFKALELSCLIAIGGEDTLGIANKLSKEGFKIVGVPKTIDNDLSNTDFTFGFDTAVNIATEAIDRLHTTARSHHRIMVVEVMGRHAGWIALHSGLAGSADLITIPELPITIDEICDVIRKKLAQGKSYCMLVVSEGTVLKGEELKMITQSKQVDAFGHVRLGGIGETLHKILEEKIGMEARTAVLGHLQRGGSPTAFDRVLGTRFGIKAMELALSGDFGKMVALKGTEIEPVSLESAVGVLKTVPAEFFPLTKLF